MTLEDFMKFIILLLSIVLFWSCDTDAKLGDPCKLLSPGKEGVTKIEQKNFDCLSFNKDGLCLSFSGADSYCTQRCGADVGCDGISCKAPDKDGNGGETCVNSICYPQKDLCSTNNPNGVCDKSKKCENGTCVSKCSTGEIYIQDSCHSESEMCSASNKTGLCVKGTICDNGTCIATGCDEGYSCKAPIELLGHPFKGRSVCIKKEDLACRTGYCSGHGTCNLDENEEAYCVCEKGYVNFGFECRESEK